MPEKNVDDILKEYGSKIESRMATFNSQNNMKVDYSQSCIKFKEEMAPEISRYERWCKSLGNLVRLKVSAADEAKIKKHLDIAHLDLEPWQPLTLSVVSFLSIFFIGLLISLALDFKKVFYNVQIGKFSTIKESLDNYLEAWRDYSIEFIEAFHLIESSLYEPDNSRRILTLEKSLKVVLDGVYDKMLKFTHDVKSPLTNVYMLGVVLPTLGLALLPLATAM